MKENYKTKKAIFIYMTVFLLSGCKSKDALTFLSDKNPINETSSQTSLPIQEEYAEILEVSPDFLTNVMLYEFIDKWMGTPYRMGGETKRGIDCSYFTQFLYHDVYDNLIERTADKQYMAPSTDKFIGQEFLKEGDLLFFNKKGSERALVTHVGVYLTNNKFVHSTSKKTKKGGNGVQISDLRDPYWQRMFVAAGRKPKKINADHGTK